MSQDFNEAPKITGNLPPALQAAIAAQKNLQKANTLENANDNASANAFPDPNEEEFVQPQFAQPQPQAQPPRPRNKNFVPPRPQMQGAEVSQLDILLSKLRQSNFTYEEIQLPSMGKFYSPASGVPKDGILHIRPMTGDEEQILATPKFIKRGKSLDMVFQKCIEEPINPELLFSIDRTFLLIYLRGISYGNEYEVQIGCPSCEKKFNTTMDLNTISIERPDENVNEELTGVLPVSNFKFSYRIATGKDETATQEHRESRLKTFGENAIDDTLLFKLAQLLVEIEGVTSKQELIILLRNLSVQDSNYIRNVVNEPPFKINTTIPTACPACLTDFDVDLPLESNFFFPKPKKKTTET
jgi:hypothetical protein